MPNQSTSIELKVEEMLKTLGIKYETQKVILEGKTVADFYIPSQRLVIYADGEFFHNSKWAEKMGKKDKDIEQNFLLGINGYNVLRLGEHEINKNTKRCINKIKQKTGENYAHRTDPQRQHKELHQSQDVPLR